jgi:glucose/arabinose dehydrogenase
MHRHSFGTRRALLPALAAPAAFLLAASSAGIACTQSDETPSRDAAGDAHSEHLAPGDASRWVTDASGLGKFCSLPGSVVWQQGSPAIVPGGARPDGGSGPDMTWLHLPDGFCSHYFGQVPETRLVRFAPNGDLFVASPSAACAGGAFGGLGSIVVLPDDNGDGYADKILHFKDKLPMTQGLLFNGGYLYYQDDKKVMRTPYSDGQRVAGSASEQMVEVNVYYSATHWPKAIDADDSGNIYVTNGGDQGENCDATLPEVARPFHGGILRIDGSANGELLARGLRNPIALRCAPGTGTCFGLELARDFAPDQGSREKLFPVHKGDDWGFPCCATANLAYTDFTNPTPSCTGVVPETTSFIIDHTPFGLDFEQGAWPGTWKSRVFVVLHGYVGSWIGARVVAIATDPKTGLPVISSESTPDGTFTDFATGWDDGKLAHGRPATGAFSPDGRFFVGNDINGDIFWIAPVGAGDQ